MDSNATPNLTGSNKPATSFSCVRCFERKVKCDRQQPCSACVKHGVDCAYRVPPPPRRRKRRVHEELMSDRLRRYEEALLGQGIDPLEVVPQAITVRPEARPSSRSTRDGPSGSADQERQYASSQLIYDQGRSRYVENNLWNRVAEEFGSPQDAIDESSEDEGKEDTPPADSTDFVLSLTPASSTARPYHPPIDQIFTLWQIFLENVNPISKIIHYPTLQTSIQQATTNLDKVPRGLEALMFAMYSAAIVSMCDKDCEYQFGEKRQVLLSRYQSATKRALERAKFLATSDLVVLQAFTIHLLTTRDQYDAKTLWVLTGVALRIAEGMGLHRDGQDLGLSIFESEIRSRIWWQLAMLDYRSAELSGSAKFRSVFPDEDGAKMPLNVDDTDLFPEMTRVPLPPARATEMVFCLTRYNFAQFWHFKQKDKKGTGEHLWQNYASMDSIAKKDKQINELQNILQANFIRFCEPIVPIQLMASLVVSGGLNSMKLVAHHPRRYGKEEDIPESERELLWNSSLRCLEAYLMVYSDRKLRRFIWHVNFHFQWQAIIYVLDCLRARPLMPEANAGWQMVDEIFETRVDFVEDTSRPLHVAMGTLCLKAYTAKEQAWSQIGKPLPFKAPDYIIKLRQQREAAHKKHAEAVAAQLGAQCFDGQPSINAQSTSTTAQLPQNQYTQQHYHQQEQTQQYQQHTPYGSDSAMNTLDTSSISTPGQDIIIPQQNLGFNPGNGAKVNGDYMHDAPNSSWFDNTYQDMGLENNGNMAGGGMNLDPNFLLTQDGNALDANAHMIDWSRWDTLLLDPAPQMK